ncbi:sensor histidine kinase [Erysipelothrix anatis]|uniref:HAMP domain-containing sensor histidine kinase n=1 Tax=Erysipelothrix anatis TaxID=2683713 RepID=UPI00135996E1|nr:HAMP domain-containing sensor histidine kinase [Erysipelothrix anatis]
MKKKLLFTTLLLILIGALGYGSNVLIQPNATIRPIATNELMSRYPHSMTIVAANYSHANDTQTEVLHDVKAASQDANFERIVYKSMEDVSKQFVNDPAIRFWLVDKNTQEVVAGSNTADFVKRDDKDLFQWSLTVYAPEDFQPYMDTARFPYERLGVRYPDNPEFQGSYTFSDKFDYVFALSANQTELKESEIATTIASNYRMYQNTAATILVAGIMILAVFFLIYPISISSSVSPFKNLWNLKLELVVIFLGILVSYATVFILSIGSIYAYRMDDIFLTLSMGKAISYGLIASHLYLAWAAVYAIYALLLFYVKRVLTFGIFRTLKEKSYTGRILCRLKQNSDEILTSPLTPKFKNRIMALVAINTLIILILIGMGSVGVVFALIYGVVLAYYSIRLLNGVKRDYLALQAQAAHIARGDFDTVEPMQTTIFRPILDELSTINKGFDHAVKEAMQSQLTKTELITNVSHDLKTPFTGIRNYSELLQDDTLDNATRLEYTMRLNSYTERLTKLIEDLFDISKASSGEIRLEFQELDIVSLVEQALIEHQDTLENRNIQVVTEIADQPLMVNLDADKTFRIFDNIIQNVVKYGMEHTRFYVDVSIQESNVRVSMKNISASPLNLKPDEVVARFVRGDKSRTETGSGLGLAIAQSFTQIQAGQFTIEIDGDLFKVIIEFPCNQ